MSHPSEHFQAPNAITRGQALKDLLDNTLVELIADALTPALPNFNRQAFISQATTGLDQLELKPRATHIGNAMAAQFSDNPQDSAQQFIAGLGPPLIATEGNGLKSFFYLPFTSFIHDHWTDWESGMTVNYSVTQRFTAEFSIRPFLIRESQRTLERLTSWINDPNPHVRRLISEGTRPRLPWAERIPAFVRDPSPVLPLLDALVDDSERYVTRSVANHLGDIAKDHLDLALATCTRWLDGANAERRWVIRHALRNPAKRGVPEAIALRIAAGGRG